MSTMPLHHVSYVVAGSMLGPPTVRYFRIAARTPADALAAASAQLGDPSIGEFRVQRAEGVAAMPGVLLAA